MKRMLSIEERIYHPDGPISSTKYVLDTYYERKDLEDLFISFTALDKLGINPQSKYSTPLGIYTYPLDWLLDNVNEARDVPNLMNAAIGLHVPFAGGNPYCWIVKVNKSTGKFISSTVEYTSKDAQKDLDWIRENKIDTIRDIMSSLHKSSDKEKVLFEIDIQLYNRNIIYQKGLFVYDVNSTRDKILSNKDNLLIIIDILFDVIAHNALVDTPFGRVWNITRYIAQNNSVSWNKLFRDMGYIGVCDRDGLGIIHHAEPFQCVFFFKRAFDIEEKVENIAIQPKPNLLKKYKTLLADTFNNMIIWGCHALPVSKIVNKWKKEIVPLIRAYEKEGGNWSTIIKDMWFEDIIETICFEVDETKLYDDTDELVVNMSTYEKFKEFLNIVGKNANGLERSIITSLYVELNKLSVS